MFGYERREPGSINALHAAFDYILANPVQKLTPNYIKNVHRLSARSCFFIEFSGWGGERKVNISPGEFKSNEYGNITMGLNWITPRGFFKMIEELGVIGEQYQTNHYLTNLKYPIQGYKKAIEEILQIYETDVASCKPYYKLKAMVKMAQSLERLHAFKDGNTRTVVLLLNRELVKHGFTPTMLDDPNRFDGHTCKEMIYEVLRGMENFTALKEAGIPPGCSKNVGHPS